MDKKSIKNVRLSFPNFLRIFPSKCRATTFINKWIKFEWIKPYEIKMRYFWKKNTSLYGRVKSNGANEK